MCLLRVHEFTADLPKVSRISPILPSAFSGVYRHFCRRRHTLFTSSGWSLPLECRLGALGILEVLVELAEVLVAAKQQTGAMVV